MNIFGTTFDYQARLRKVRKLMDERDIDAILVHLWPNQYYISGVYQNVPWYPIEICVHTETPLIVFRDSGKDPVFLVTSLIGYGLMEATWIKDVRFVDKEPLGKKSWWEYTAEALKEKGVDAGTVGIEEDICVLSTFRKLQSALPKARFTAADQVFQTARKIKEPEEIALIRESVLIAEAGLKAGMEAAKVGVLEIDVQKEAEIEMKRRGAIREVESMCQSGIRTANFRSFASNWKKIEKDDLVMIDIGCVYKGYGSDISRTWVVGKPTDAQKKMTDDLVAIYEKVLGFMKPGVTVQEIKELGRNELGKAGYSTNSLAPLSDDVGIGEVTLHGIGLGPMHDAPHFEDSDVPLESGMTLAVSAIIRQRTSTIRFEDNMVVMPEGIEKINKLIPWKL